MNSEPLEDDDLTFIEDILEKYGNDDSILCASELDGFLTAIVSGPNMLLPSQWMPEIWGGAGNEPEWESEQEVQRFMSLVMRNMNNNIDMLMHYPDEFECLFDMGIPAEEGGDPVLIPEEWCFGYIRGMTLGDWPEWSELPEELKMALDMVALFGLEDNFDVVENLSMEEHQELTHAIAPAAAALYHYFLQQRAPGSIEGALNRPMPEVRTEPKTGRNDPCPCGSGKKYKKCCLH
ncbi:UPF0149 family protein [Paraneptunicella aestuarii]|uniref:UPF0149 family protein n=1 Tax=Paraneptunicella aestuarii TaxID=2831148 RepID=UPI001E4C6236|nr:UPF0149 family protein [Paraneptunicella aestuarii]UAA38578.1 UPF0149 family protein [Paraneptunicella aestuarii]